MIMKALKAMTEPLAAVVIVALIMVGVLIFAITEAEARKALIQMLGSLIGFILGFGGAATLGTASFRMGYGAGIRKGHELGRTNAELPEEF